MGRLLKRIKTKSVLVGFDDPPFFGNVRLLLPMDGSDGSSAFTDVSSFGNTITTVGSVEQDDAQQLFSENTGLFSGGYLRTSLGPLSTNDFTIEFFVRFANAAGSSEALIDMRPSGTNGAYVLLNRVATGEIQFFTTSAQRIVSSTVIASGTWTHIALCRNSAVTRLFIGGTQEGGDYADTNDYLSVADRPFIGALSASVGSAPLDGHMANLRFTFGEGVYTEDFTPPAGPFATS